MKQKTKQTLAKRTVNAFGALGYLLCVFLWFWATMLYIRVIQSAALFVTPKVETDAPEIPHFTFTTPQPLEIAVLVVVTIAVIALTVYVLIKMPSSVVHTSKTAVHKTSEKITPLVIKAQHQKDTQKARLRITARLVGHSCGAGFIVRWLSEHINVRVNNVVLVAPSLGLDWDTNGFFDFMIDPKLVERTKKLAIFISDDDRDAIKQAAKKLRDTIPNIQYREFHGYGHFCFEDMKTTKFPELRDELLGRSDDIRN